MRTGFLWRGQLLRLGAGLVRGWLAERKRRGETAALAGLDAATLRDLGIDRSESGSFAAEASGFGQVTRRRIVRRSRGVLQ